MEDLALRGGTVDVGVRDGRVSAIGSVGPARRDLDVSGLVVGPGRIEPDAHEGAAALAPKALARRLLAGFTTVVVGGCGRSVTPAWAAGTCWPTYEAFFRWLDDDPPPVNVGAFVGHATLRLEAMGYAARPWWPSERKLMTRWLQEGLDAGCLGFSSALHREPTALAPPSEIEALVAVTAAAGGVWSTSLPAEKPNEAVDRIAGAPAPAFVCHPPRAARKAMARAGLRTVDQLCLGDRGRLEVGAPADVVVSTPEGGVRHVVVNGIVAVQDGELTGSRSGVAVRRAI